MFKNRKYVLAHIFATEILVLAFWLGLGNFLGLEILEILAIAFFMGWTGFGMIYCHQVGLAELGTKEKC